MMEELSGLDPRAFDKADAASDAVFYAEPRFVTHIDDGAIRAVTALYRTVLPEGGVILDLMSSWVSHLPEEVAFERVIGHGMNAEELAANARLDSYFVQDLNRDPRLALKDASLDAVCLCVSVQYLQQPVAVFREIARCLRPGAPMVITFSNRCFPTKAVAIWQALSPTDQQRLLLMLLSRAGLRENEVGAVLPDPDDLDWRDPIYAVIGRTAVESSVAESSPGRSGPGRSGPGRSGSGRSGPGRSGSGRSGPGRSGPGRSGPGRSGPLEPLSDWRK